MDKQAKAKLLKALRSGEYEQGRGALCRRGLDGVDRFCCLGVLQNEMEGFDQLPSVGGGAAAVADGSAIDGFLGGSLASGAFGLSKHMQWKLADMNDGGKSFHEIADWIEANL